MQTEIIAKATGTTTTTSANVIELNAPSVVRLDLDRSQVAAMEREGNDLIIRLTDGQTIRIDNFYDQQQGRVSDLVLRDDQGGQWLAHPSASGSGRFTAITDLDDLMAAATEQGGGSSFILPAVLGVAGVGGVVAAVSGGGGNDRNQPGGPNADIQPPATPTASFTANGTSIRGTGEAGATIRVTDGAGSVIGTGTVAPDGTFTIPVNPPQTNGQPVTIVQSDAAGNVSPSATTTAPDITPPVAPTETISGDGASVTGTGEPGATVTVRNAAGQVLGTATVGAQGSYTLPLTTPQANGGTLTVIQSDPAGNVSPAITLAAPDITPPAAPTAILSADGTTVTGSGEPGATVRVVGSDGQPIGSAIVAADGGYTITLATPQTSGGVLVVTQTDAAGNVSPTTELDAIDATPMPLPTAEIDAQGTTITGTGEPAATVIVRDANGETIGQGTVDADGNYSLTLTTPQGNGETLTVVQSDAAGNVSPTITLVAPDFTAPAAPTAIIAADGASIIGTGEPGATVTVRDAAGQPLGTATVDPQGNYPLPLATPQANGETLTVTQSDPAGNISPATTISAPDTSAPTAPTAIIAADGASITGIGEPGATVTVRDPAGQPLGTATVDPQGNYTLPLATPQANGETLTITQSDPAGNISPATTISAPDTSAPTAPTAIIAADGASISGTGEPGATVTVRDAAGQPLGTATVDPQGNYTLPLATPQANGETLTVTQSDPAGNISPATTISAPDTTPPTAPIVAISADGSMLSGTGEPGAAVQVVDAGGQPVGTATVGGDGRFSVALPTGTTNGQTLSVVQTDAAGNASPASTVVTPDLIAPAAPAATVSPDGTSISGTGEAGATLVVRAPDGSVLANVVIAADGSFNTTLITPQANGEALIVTQTDAQGNVSPGTTIIAPDITPPAPPVATLSADGAAVYGNGEPGAIVRIVDGNGTLLGSAVVASDSSFTLDLTPPQTGGQTLSAVQTDPAGNPSQPATVAAPDLTAPAAPIATIAADGTSVTGTGEPFATVRVRSADGTEIATAIVGADGGFSAPLSPPQANGEALSLDQTDRGGNLSPATSLTAPDITAPTGLIAAISGDGAIVSGSGEAGATVTIRDANGAVIGTATVAANGSYSATLTTPQTNGEILQAIQADAAGNVSDPASVIAPDTTPPLAPTGSVIDAGATLSGTGEVGAIVTIRATDGTLLGSGQVGADGSFAVTLTPVQANGQNLQLVQTDAAGNDSPIIGVTAPDITAPTGLTATISGDGAIITGVGEVGATVTVRDPAGAIIGTAVVGANGSYAAPLTPAQINGETLQVTQADVAGNVSLPLAPVAPDLTAPLAPLGTVSADGTLVNGSGEPGATVTVRDAAGQILGTGQAAADGSFAVQLSSAQRDGQTLSVVQTDAAGNVSPPLALTALDTTAPTGLTASVDGTGTIVSGQAEAGASITVRDPDGAIIGTGTASVTGAYALTLTPAQLNGQLLQVTQTDVAGNTSPPSPAAAPDLTAPDAPFFTLDGTGANATGSGEVGATVTLRDADGTVIGNGQVGADGSFTVALTPAQANGGTVSATLTDAAGNVSAPTNVTAPDITPPAAPVAALDATGTIVTGEGEVGAAVTVRDVGGGVLGSAIVGPQGAYMVVLSAPQLDSQVLSVTQADAAGNGSPETIVTALDGTPPAPPVATVSADGTIVSGTGEIGATVTITDPVGLVLATVPVGADGSFSVTLSTALTNGQVLTLTQADAAGNVSPPSNAVSPDLIPNDTPDTPTATVAADGASVTGIGQAGAAIIVRDANGAVIGNTQVGGDGSYTATLTPPQRDGETVRVTQTDADGDVSPPAAAIAPDLTPPAAPVAAIDPTGMLVSGTGEVGATVRVLDASGTPLGTATVGANGAYAVLLATPQVDGQPLTVVQSDAAGNASPASPVTAPDLTAPLAPIGTVSFDGTTLTGTGEIGATVTIRGPDGAVIGTALVDANGNFSAPLTPVQANGQIVTLTQADPAGNVSPIAQATAPDIIAPTGLTAAIDGTGGVVTGIGEAGATVTIRDLGGTVLGTAVVAANGSYAAILTPPQINAQLLQVTQADAAGNVSSPATVIAPDLTAPLAPVGTVSGDGTTLTGTGEAGATVTIRGPDSAVIGTALVDTNGNFTALLNPVQANGQIVTLTQADAAGNVSPIVQATAPDITAPTGLTAAINGVGTLVTGQGEAGATVTVRDAGGNPIGTAIVAANGSYTVALTTPQANGQALTVTQADAAGNAAPPSPLTAPDISPPAAPLATVNGTGTIVTGSGEPGATVRVLGAQGQLVGSAVVADNGSYTATLTIPQANGQALTVTQLDGAGNVSPQTPLAAPDITPPAPPTAAINATGTIVIGTGEPGTTVEIRNAAGTVIGTGTVAAGGGYAVTLATPQVAGETLNVGLRDGAGNVSGTVAVIAPFDISAFDNVASAQVDLVPVQTNETLGNANYTALVSLGLVNLNAQVLAIPNVQFTVQPGHMLDTTFTYDATLSLGVASGYSVVIQRFDGTNWVGVNGGGNSSLLEVSLLGGNLVANADLGPGQYRAFVTFDNTLGVGLLGGLSVTGVNSDFTDIGQVIPAAANGNVITDPGPTGQVDVVSPQTRVESVTLNGVTTAITGDDTQVVGQWGTLIIDRDGSYSYTPNADAGVLGKTDSFTYTLFDASDGERESATLTVAIGSPDVTGAPIAVNDGATATATFANVVETRAPAVDSTFNTPTALVLNGPQTGRVVDSFTVDANSVSNVTLTAAIAPGLSVLPSYAITVTNAAGTVVGTASGAAVAGVAGLLGSGLSVTMNGLPPGTYNYTVTSTNTLGTGYATSVYVGETITRLDRFTLTGTSAASGDLLANDTLGSSFLGVKVLVGGEFVEVGDTPRILTGTYGTLTINEVGQYTYQPSTGIPYAATDPIDRFTYQIVQPDGQVSTARLDVAVDINNGVAPVFPATLTAFALDEPAQVHGDVAPMTLAVEHGPAPLSLDQADTQVALSLMEGEGSLEDVLSRYLNARSPAVEPLPSESLAATDNFSAIPSASDISAQPPVAHDPLGYLTVSVDPDQERLATLHLV